MEPLQRGTVRGETRDDGAPKATARHLATNTAMGTGRSKLQTRCTRSLLRCDTRRLPFVAVFARARLHRTASLASLRCSIPPSRPLAGAGPRYPDKGIYSLQHAACSYIWGKPLDPTSFASPAAMPANIQMKRLSACCTPNEYRNHSRGTTQIVLQELPVALPATEAPGATETHQDSRVNE
jgi:hypothetical protein